MKRLLCIALFTVACGGPERPGAGGSKAGPTVGTQKASLTEAHRAPEEVRTYGSAAASLVVNAIQSASVRARTGQPVTYGTLTNEGWAPEPADRLVVQAEDARYEVTVDGLDGDFASADAFLAGDHLLDAQVTDGASALDLRLTREGATRQIHVAGRLQVDGVTYQVDLTAAGTERFDNDTSGTAYADHHQVSGTVDWNGAHLLVDETWDFELVSSGRTASSAVRTIRNRLDAAGRTFLFDGVRLKKAFRDGNPTEVDTFWEASGAITADGAPFGSYALDQSDAAFIKLLLRLPDQTVEVESWKLY